ncbi:hypothetical protein CONPUDRAFT_164944 [Coniophora puteana RWD-64-598 SS2]|uniref:Cellular morphogenesis-related protein n=1 Tax=Coniophora puteana (strain RWD-64-598) TaxID=741705 RepID=A0A5M3MUD3_CONPW|nr:uncharacterized protein CONPUDRAFT_164944 [Coniophora puteana RWD-64-598 SS2]EIW82325.1 hypothetical protein CONPUDRAFT_164944 [Coniophora puteana RWD-64-598 SS2]
MHIFTPNHVHLIAACSPPSSALLSAGPEYRPNAQELSKLTYYAANRPGKINKLGSELEKRIKSDSHKAQAGNARARASLLINLAILRDLAVECRREISLLSPSLVASIKNALDALLTDLEVSARAASVFTAWCTYTDGHVIGADAMLNQDYLSILHKFADQSVADRKSVDDEMRNRARLVGLAALNGVVTSDVLYSSSTHFKAQVSVIIQPILYHIINTDPEALEESAVKVKGKTTTSYLQEYRTKPQLERRAASIHAHVDGESGPSTSEVVDASLRVLLNLMQHSSGGQVGVITQAIFESLEQLQGWERKSQCQWLAQKICEWTQYQYRYALPTRLVEQLLDTQDSPEPTSQQVTLVAMVTMVFTSSIPLINLSTSDIISNLISLVLRRVSILPDDPLLPALVEAISSLGCHIYYSDQISDLAAELISRLTSIENQSVLRAESENGGKARSQAVRTLLSGLLGLMNAANNHAQPNELERQNSMIKAPSVSQRSEGETVASDPHPRVLRRTRVSAETWRETLTFLCDADFPVRSDYAQSLVNYMRIEIPKREAHIASDGVRRPAPLSETSPTVQVNSVNLLLFGDSTSRFLHAVHAHVYILATSTLVNVFNVTPSPDGSRSADLASTGVVSAIMEDDSGSVGNSIDPHTSSPQRCRSLVPSTPTKRQSTLQRLVDPSTRVSSSTTASLSDYAHILMVLIVIHEEMPIRSLLTGVPMLLALDDAATCDANSDELTKQRAKAVLTVLAQVWLKMAKTWNCPELAAIATEAMDSLDGPPHLPSLAVQMPGVLRPAEQPVLFGDEHVTIPLARVDTARAVVFLSASRSAQEATGLDEESLHRRLTTKWSPELALKESVERPSSTRHVTDGTSHLKLSPALMAIENMSLASLTRSVRGGVGVSDLREALEGRNNASNPALAKAPSLSTLDHTSSYDHRLELTKVRSRPKKRSPAPGTGNVRDVLDGLGIGKQSGNNLLKASFPALQKSATQSSSLAPDS